MSKRNPARKANSRPKGTRIRPSQLHGPLHPFRTCPIGTHWVRATVVTSKLGNQFERSSTCRRNRSGKDQLYKEEIESIAERFFASLSGPPGSDNLGFKAVNADGTAYDVLIRGWTKYWNEILQPDRSLDPNLVKALIATESGFDANADTKSKGPGRARGLMQVTDATRTILQNENGELLEHLLTVTDDDAYNPNMNIAAGNTMAFHKRYLASRKYKRQIDWIDAALEYKDMLRKPRTEHERRRFPEVRQKIIEFTRTLDQE